MESAAQTKERPRVDLRRWHGVALVILAASIPLGEGLGLGALTLVALGLLVRHREIDWGVLMRPTMRTILIAWGVWFAAGLAMTGLGGAGWLKPSEIGVQTPLLAAPIVLLATSAVDRVWLQRAAAAFVLVLLVTCALGVIQYVMNVRLGESLQGAASSVISQGRIPGDSLRAAAGGFFVHRLKMAHVLVIGIGILMARLLFDRLTATRRAVELSALALAGLALLLTFTRGALLATAAGTAVCVLFASKRWRQATLLGAGLAILVVISVPTVRQRVISIAGRQASSVRGLIWSQGVSILGNHPLGAGLGNYRSLIPRYYDLVSPQFAVRTYPHSLVLSVWAETGPIGLLAFVWAWFAFLLACVRRVRGPPGTAQTAAAAGLFGGLAIWVVGMTHDVLFHKPVALAFAGMLGLVLALIDEPAKTTRPG